MPNRNRKELHQSITFMVYVLLQLGFLFFVSSDKFICISDKMCHIKDGKSLNCFSFCTFASSKSVSVKEGVHL